MTEHPIERDLHRHYDGELPARESWAIEGHLRECAQCAATYDRIRSLVDRVAELPESIEPPADLWPAIAGRLGEMAPDELGPRRSRSPDRRTTLLVGWIGAVAAALVLGIGLGRFLPVELPSLTTAEVAPEAEFERLTNNPETMLASYEEPAYDLAVAELENVLQQMRGELEPETIAVVEANLAIIDAAIEEARDALLADPANAYLHHHLSNTMQRKLKLLRTVTAAVTSNT